KPAAATPPPTQPTSSPLTDVWLGPRFVFSTQLGRTKMGSVVVYLMIYVQDMARSASPVATATPDCILVDGATQHDACMAPIIDLWRSPRYALSDEPTRSLGFENVVVGLTVHADGSVDDVLVVQSSCSSW